MLKLIRLSFSFLAWCMLSFYTANAQPFGVDRMLNPMDNKNELSDAGNQNYFGNMVIPDAYENPLMVNTTLDVPQTSDQNVQLYEKLCGVLSSLKVQLDELSYILSGECAPIADQFTDDLVLLHSQLDSLKLELDSLFHNDKLNEVTCKDVEQGLVELDIKLKELQASVEMAYHEYLVNNYLYEDYLQYLSYLKDGLDELSYILSGECAPIADQFTDDLVLLHSQLDSLKLELDSLFHNDQLNEVTCKDVEQGLVELDIKLKELQASVEMAYQEYLVNKDTYEALLQQMEQVHYLLQEVIEILKVECPHVANEFAPVVEEIEQQIMDVLSEIQKAYAEGSSVSEYSGDIDSIMKSINSLKVNAKEAEEVVTGIDDVVLNDQSSVSVYNLEGKRLYKVQKGLNLVKFANGQVKKVLIR